MCVESLKELTSYDWQEDPTWPSPITSLLPSATLALSSLRPCPPPAPRSKGIELFPSTTWGLVVDDVSSARMLPCICRHSDHARGVCVAAVFFSNTRPRADFTRCPRNPFKAHSTVLGSNPGSVSLASSNPQNSSASVFLSFYHCSVVDLFHVYNKAIQFCVCVCVCIFRFFSIFLKKKLYLFWLHWVFVVALPLRTWDLSPLTRDWTLAPCVGRQVLQHWATREVLHILFHYYKVLNIVPWAIR